MHRLFLELRLPCTSRCSFQIPGAKLEEKWSYVLCINKVIISQHQNRNAEEKHLALNLENAFLLWSQIRKVVDLALFNTTCEEGRYISA